MDIKEKKYWIECDCHTHLVQVTHWVDEDDTFLTWWEMGPNTTVSIWERLKLARKALRYGYVADYELCLSQDNRAELIKALEGCNGTED